MPHDKNGDKIEIGDLVTLTCTVTNIHSTEEYCNVSLETVEVMFPEEYKSNLTANAKQVVKVKE